MIDAYTAAPGFPDRDAFAAVYGETGLWDVACLPFREYLTFLGLRRSELARKYGIPLSTLDQWISGKCNPPPYVRLLLAIAEGKIEWRNEI